MASSSLTWTSSQSPDGGLRPCQHGVDHVERREIDDARLCARLARRPPRIRGRCPCAPCTTMNSVRAIRCRQPARVAQLRVFDAERRGLADLPAHELVEIVGALGNFFEPQQRDFRHAVGNGQRHASGPGAHPLECAPKRRARPPLGSAMFAAFSDGDDGAGRQRLHRVRRHRQVGVARDHRRRRDAVPRNFDGHGRRRRRQEGLIQRR